MFYKAPNEGNALLRLVENKVYCLPLVLFVQVLLLLNLFVSPAFAQKPKVNLKKYKVEIRPLDKQVRKKYQLKLTHPYSFQLRTIQKSLVALRFKKKDIFNVQKGRIFNNDLVRRLAPLIRDKFSQANSNQLVSFEISNASGKPYIRGDTFLTSEGFHWRFTALRSVQWGIEDFSVSGEPWVLVLKKNHSYKQRYWKGTQVAQDIMNWVVFEIVLPVSSRRLPEPVPHRSVQQKKRPSKKHTVSEVEERLHLLEQLRKKNVITEEEYEDKRREILGQL